MTFTIDLHTHSVASNHAYSTLQEMASHAASQGMTAFALTDHGPALPGGAHLYHFANMRILPPTISGVEILKGAEANILSTKGKLDIDDGRLKKLDVVLAGFHYKTGYRGKSVKDHTKAVISVIESGRADIICHPGNPSYPLDYRKFVQAAHRNNVAIEMNNSSFHLSRKGSQQNCRNILAMAKEEGAFISLGSDAHISFDVGNFDVIEKLVTDIGYPRERIINSDRKLLADFLASRRGG